MLLDSFVVAAGTIIVGVVVVGGGECAWEPQSEQDVGGRGGSSGSGGFGTGGAGGSCAEHNGGVEIACDGIDQNCDGTDSCDVGWWDACYQYRRQISVAADTAALPDDYTAAFTFDHAALTTVKSLANGDDIRIVYWDGAIRIELDRVLEKGSAWDTTSTTVLFNMYAAIPAFATDARYYMYYGCDTADSPPAVADNVYWYQSDFSTGGLADWSSFDTSVSSCNWTVGGGNPHIVNSNNCKNDGGNPAVGGKLVLAAMPQVQDLGVELRFLSGDNDLMGFGLCSMDTATDGFYVGSSFNDNWFYSSNPPTDRVGYWVSSIDTAFSTPSLSRDTWYDIEALWTSSGLSIWLDGSLLNAWPTGPTGPGYFCLFTQSNTGSEFDDILLRRNVDSPPTITSGGEVPR